MEDKDKILLKQIFEEIKKQIEKAIEILGGEKTETIDYAKKVRGVGKIIENGEEKIIEGVFDGEKMIGPQGEEYLVPPNYASKSRLVEGDLLKLTILSDGSFIFKQIAPVKRERMKGILARDERNQFYVLAQGRTYRVLTASVTYFKAKEGDELVIIVPEGGNSKWAAVENVL